MIKRPKCEITPLKHCYFAFDKKAEIKEEDSLCQTMQFVYSLNDSSEQSTTKQKQKLALSAS